MTTNHNLLISGYLPMYHAYVIKIEPTRENIALENILLIKVDIEVDIDCSLFSAFVAHDILDLAIYVISDGFGILVPYPILRTSGYGYIMIFSTNL